MNRAIRLLYAEDNPGDRQRLQDHFESFAPGIHVETVLTGEACLQRLQAAEFDALLLDNRLPDMDAIDVLKALEHARLAMPVIVVTGSGDENLVVRLVRLGAWDYVSKAGDYIERLPTIVRTSVMEFRRRRRGHAARRRQRRILYVERHAADRDLTAAHFKQHAANLDLTGVRSAAEGLSRLAEERFDLVLTDLRVPDMNALDLLREIRHRSIQVPVIVVSGQGDEAAAAAALKLGAFDYIVKREDYLARLPYAIEHAIDRFELEQLTERLQLELSERQRAEVEGGHFTQQAEQAQKLDSLGRLAGGVAHDFNNLLTVILGQVDLLLGEQAAPVADARKEGLLEIRRSAERAAALTRQLLAFSRRQILQPRVIDLNEVIRDHLNPAQRLLGDGIEIVLRLAPDLAPVTADPAQIGQVFLNVAANARDAMPRGGKLIIQTRNVSFDVHDPHRHASFPPGAYVMLALRDTGQAIDAETLPHIFEPFFVPREQERGGGLRLSTVYGIVKQSGGWVHVDSAPGHGSTFRVYLPRCAEPPTQAEDAGDLALPRGHETVLLVEDDEGVRGFAGIVLRRCGYQVLEAANGLEGLAICEKRDLPIALMLTDIVMPHLTGPDLAIRVRPLRPDLRIMFMSGYTDNDAIVRNGLVDQSIVFLAKPFTARTLARTVREVLDAPPARQAEAG